jgi:hypothetical protein
MSKVDYINKEQVLPEEYRPTGQIIFCSNTISNYKFLINVNGFYPLLIGDGEIPRIWLFSRTPNNDIMTLIDDSVSNVNVIKIDIRNSDRKIEIKETIQNTIILKLSYNNIPTITYLNLNPIGYLITGDETKLTIGTNSISGNRFSGVKTIIGLGIGPEMKKDEVK